MISHQSDIASLTGVITDEVVQSLLPDAPDDPNKPQEILGGFSPLELAHNGWFPQPGSDGEIRESDREVALSRDERAAIVGLAEERGTRLLEAWSQFPAFVVHPAVQLLGHLFNHHLVDEPEK